MVLPKTAKNRDQTGEIKIGTTLTKLIVQSGIEWKFYAIIEPNKGEKQNFEGNTKIASKKKIDEYLKCSN